MITSLKLGGGGQLGNQLWGLAMLFGVAAKHGYEIAIPKHRHLPKRKGGYELDFWDLECREFDPANDQVTTRYEEKSLCFDPAVFEQPDGTDFRGYFQSYKYILDPASLAQQYLRIVHGSRDLDELVQSCGKTPYVAVNVRRDDYLATPDIHLILSAEYYNKAMAAHDHADFFVVSDDIPWCQTNLRPPAGRHVVFSPLTYYFDNFVFMTVCQGMIGSASSFSWWAAWLQRARGEVFCTVFPSEWYGPAGPHHCINDILPPDWTRRPALRA
jgi:hypothetical protein